MSEQYFSASPKSESRPSRFTVDFAGESYVFACDRGVFSVGELDEGTRILLESLPPLSGRVLDLGCGWGPVGTILGRQNSALEIVMCDVNERAVELSRESLQLNGVTNASVLLSDGFSAVEGCFDAIVTNPPIRAGKQLIYRLFDDALTRLKPGGSLYIVIRRQQGAESALKHLAAANARVINKHKGFWILRAGGQNDE